jgi:hypothetical protein
MNAASAIKWTIVLEGNGDPVLLPVEDYEAWLDYSVPTRDCGPWPTRATRIKFEGEQLFSFERPAMLDPSDYYASENIAEATENLASAETSLSEG